MINCSINGEINSLFNLKYGEYFVTVSFDKVIKIWYYNSAIPKWIGVGNSGEINRIVISLNQELLIFVSNDGAIFMFESPKEVKITK